MSLFNLFGTNAGSVPKGSPAVDQPHQLALYKYNACPFCQRVLRAIRDLSLDIELRDIQQSSEHRKALRDQTGRTTVPCLFIDGQPMFESLDIIAWLQAHEAALAG